MYSILINHLRELINKLDLQLYLVDPPKVMNILDSINHVSIDFGVITPIKLYYLLRENTNSLRVYRRAIVGILTRDINLGYSVKLLGSMLNIITYNMGSYIRVNDFEHGLNLVDIMLVDSNAVENINFDHCIEVKWFNNINVKVCRYRFKTIIILPDRYRDIAAYTALLYIVRPMLHILFKEPFLTYPLIKIEEYSDLLSIYPIDKLGKLILDCKHLYGFKILSKSESYIEILDPFISNNSS